MTRSKADTSFHDRASGIYTPRQIVREGLDCRLVGNKAYLLAKVSCALDCVPPWFCLSSRTMRRCLEEDEKGTVIQDQVSMYLLNKISLHRRLKDIRESIESLALPVDIAADVANRLKRMKAPFAVRSSSACEDGVFESNAGLFESILDVSPDGVLGAILRCWSSIYSESTFVHLTRRNVDWQDLQMAVIVQEMVPARSSGVLFTANPISGDGTEMIYEAATGAGAEMVSGQSGVLRGHFDRVTNQIRWDRPTSCASEGLIRKLAGVGGKLEALFGCPQDIEWAEKEGKLFVLQSRPITALCRHIFEEVKVFSVHELNDKLKEDLCYLKSRYEHWLKKKIPFYRACAKVNAPTSKWLFMCFQKSILTEKLCRDVSAQFSAPAILMGVNENLVDIHIKTSELYEELDRISSYFNGGGLTVSMRESFPSELSIIASPSQDRGIYMEYLPGAIKGLNAGKLLPSRVLLDTEGRVVYHKKKHFKSQICLEENSMEFIEGAVVSPPVFDEKDMREVAYHTRRIMDAFGKPLAVEWWKWKGFLVANDASKIGCDSIEATDPEDKCTTISRGHVHGHVVDCSRFETDDAFYMSHGRGIGVLVTEKRVKHLRIVQQIRQEIGKARHSDQPIVLYTSRPYLLLSAVIEDVDGCVFQDASLLCHLCIILRERGIPAVSLNGSDHVPGDAATVDYGMRAR